MKKYDSFHLELKVKPHKGRAFTVTTPEYCGQLYFSRIRQMLEDILRELALSQQYSSLRKD